MACEAHGSGAAPHNVSGYYAARDVPFCFAGAKGPVLDILRRSGLFDQIGSDCFFLEVDEAVRAGARRFPIDT